MARSVSSPRSCRTSTSARCAASQRSTRTGRSQSINGFPVGRIYSGRPQTCCTKRLQTLRDSKSQARPASPVLKVIVAPNSFKGSLSASQAAAAIARGVREARPDADVVEIPVADGGEGTVEALVSARKGTYQSVEVEGPLGDPVHATCGLIDDGRTGVVELASASGLTQIPTEKRDQRKASTYGFGQLLEAVRQQGVVSLGSPRTHAAGAEFVRQIIAGIGGSATND